MSLPFSTPAENRSEALYAQIAVSVRELLERRRREAEAKRAKPVVNKPAPALSAAAQARIERLQAEYRRVEADSRYADGPAYAQDRERMRRISAEIDRIRMSGEV